MRITTVGALICVVTFSLWFFWTSNDDGAQQEIGELKRQLSILQSRSVQTGSVAPAASVSVSALQAGVAENEALYVQNMKARDKLWGGLFPNGAAIEPWDLIKEVYLWDMFAPHWNCPWKERW
jgi:hypothetical protein